MGTKNYITVLEEGHQGWRFGSELAVYTERLLDGRLICASYRDNGIVIHPRDEEQEQAAFDLVIDGQSMYYGWEYEDFQSETKDDDLVVGMLTLRHTGKPVLLKIVTQCSGFGFFKRTMEITNTSAEATIGLTSITPLCGSLWQMSDNLRENLKDNSVIPYSVGHFKDFYWTHEGNFDWQDIPLNTRIAYAASEGKSGFSHPFFVLRNNLYGGYFIGQLAWSSSWEMSFFTDFFNPEYAPQQKVALNFSIRPVCTSPARLIAPGETIRVPEVHFGISHEDFDAAIQNLHSYQRKCVLRKVGDGLQPVMYNTWGFMEESMNEERLKQEIDIASEIGAELFIIDAGWFGDDNSSNWFNSVGDWYTRGRLPNDLFGVLEYARGKGLKCGLWVELEAAAGKSRIAGEHPDWFITRYGKQVERILDLSKPEVKEFLQAEVIRIVERYQLDLFRLDYNIYDHKVGGFNSKDGWSENTLWRHVEALYEIFDQVKQRFPDLQMDNCAGGGGRTDVGIMSRFTTTQSSDWVRMPRTVRILNGLSMALPPDYTNKWFGVCLNGSYRGNADTLMHAVIMAQPVISGITPALAEANPALLACVKKYLRIYKEFIRTFQREAKVYHHTPVIPGADGTGWCALEYVSEDKCRAVAAVFKLLNAEENVYHLCFRGLNEDLLYQIHIEPGEKSYSASGYTLVQQGLDIRLDTALTSRLLLLTAIEVI